MKYKTIEKIPPRMPGSSGRVFTTEYLSDGKTFVLDYWNNFVHKGRYAMNKETGEYASQHITHTWTNRGLLWFYQSDPSTSNYYVYMSTKEKEERIIFEDLPGQQALRDFLQIDSNVTPWCRTLYDNITRRENEYNVSRRATTSRNHFARVEAVMEKIPQRPSDLEEWIDKVAAGGADYLMAVKETGEYSCTACGKTSKPEQIIRANKKEMPKNKKKCKCPKCRSEVIMAKTGVKDIRARFYCMQNVDETMSVSRHFQVHINYPIGDKKRIWLSEAVRFLMLRGFNSQRGGAYEIYYNQIPAYCYGQFYTGDNSWNTKKSWGNRFMGSGYLYPHGVTEALNGTEYEDWSRTFEAAGRLGIDMDYNLLMSSTTENMPNVCELLIKGRFYNMVREVACKVNVWNGAYYGPLEISGHSIEAVFGIDLTLPHVAAAAAHGLKSLAQALGAQTHLIGHGRGGSDLILPRAPQPSHAQHAAQRQIQRQQAQDQDEIPALIDVVEPQREDQRVELFVILHVPDGLVLLGDQRADHRAQRHQTQKQDAEAHGAQIRQYFFHRQFQKRPPALLGGRRSVCGCGL